MEDSLISGAVRGFGLKTVGGFGLAVLIVAVVEMI
jgi:hypothetical protein